MYLIIDSKVFRLTFDKRKLIFYPFLPPTSITFFELRRTAAVTFVHPHLSYLVRCNDVRGTYQVHMDRSADIFTYERSLVIINAKAMRHITSSFIHWLIKEVYRDDGRFYDLEFIFAYFERKHLLRQITFHKNDGSTFFFLRNGSIEKIKSDKFSSFW